MRDWIFAFLLLVAFALIVRGVAGWSPSAGWLTAGVLLCVWVVLVFVVGDAFAPADVDDDELGEADRS